MQRNTRSLQLLIAAGLLLSQLAPLSAASLADAIASMTDMKAPNIKVGQLALHPYYKIVESYDSNIFLQPRSKIAGQNANNNAAGPVIGSWITDNNLGLNFDMPFSEIDKLTGGYDFVWRDYSKDPATNNTINQGANLAFDHKGGSLEAGLHDSYVNTTDPATSELTARSKRWANDFGGSLDYAPNGGDFYGGLDADHTVNKYIADNPALRAALDRYQEDLGGRFGYKVQPQTKVYGSYTRSIIHYTIPAGQSKDSKSHKIDFGIQGEIAPKVTGKVETGVSLRKYDAPPTAGGKTTTTNWTVSTNLLYKPLERTSVSLNLSRSLAEATFGNNQFFISNQATLGISHKLPGKVTLGANGGIEIDKYPESQSIGFGATPQNRRDDLYSVGASLDYNIQAWLKLGVSHTYRQRNSIFTEQFNYVDNITAFKLGLQF